MIKLANGIKPSYTPKLLSGSTNGKGIKVAATATPGTLIHTAIAGTSSVDEVWLWAYNGHTADVLLTLEWGGVAVPDDNVIVNIPTKQGRFLLVEGRLLQNGLVIRAFAANANLIVIDGFANQYD